MRYSLTYLERGDPIPDSSRFRRRLYHIQIRARGIYSFVSAELGIEVEPDYDEGIVQYFFERAELRDILDYITLAVVYARARNLMAAADRFIKGVRRILNEENIAFGIDDDGKIHPRIDNAFSANQVAAIAALEGARYENVRQQFDHSEEALNSGDPDYKQAIRSIFNANEGLFRLIAPNAPRLGAKEVREHISPILDILFSGDQIGRRSAARLQKSYEEWIDSAHNYRHEAGQPEPAQPPESLAIALISQGVAMLRWLARVDQAKP